ncbi:MAG TPA: AAA family ATPase [Candidatus Aquilonibacter sp.]|nr:AAA family ATPase [Candidatus Aquilonibacter sp.]
MFERHFKFADQPFGATPDPHFLLRTKSHREALASLYMGFYTNRGFTVLIAEPGMGKTTLLSEFLNHIRSVARTVFLFDTLGTPDDVLSMILQELGVRFGETAAERHRQLNELLATEARAGRKVVVVIDEAQNLSLEALEAIRLLSNFETSRSKLMQVVLCGQTQLADKLARPEAIQLLQRVSTMCRLTRLNATETIEYVEHRLKLAGHAGRPIFTPTALRLLADASRGIPRVINMLCFNSLCLCRASSSRVVDESTMAEAISDLHLPIFSSAPSVHREPRASALPPIPLPALDPIAEVLEVQLSSSGFRRHVIVALLTLSIALGATGGLINGSQRYLGSPSAALSHVWHTVGTKEAKTAHQTDIPTERTPSIVSTPNQLPVMGATQHKEAFGLKQITVAPRQNLETIARANLGDYDPYILREIRALNPYITDPNHIEIGRTIRLPEARQANGASDAVRSQP